MGRLWLFLIIGLLISAFGPYFPSGGRCDHFVVFLGSFFAFFYWIFRDRRLNELHRMSLLLLVAVCICVVGDFFAADTRMRVVTYWNAVGRLLYPGLLGFSLATLFGAVNPTRRDLERALFSFLWCGVFASLVAIGSKFYFITSIVELYAGVDRSGLWYELYSLNRFTGLFIQPLEAGAFYSLVLFVAIYLWYVKSISNVAFLSFIFFISLGGVACFSKVYLVLGMGLGGILGILLFRKMLWKFVRLCVPLVFLTWTLSFYFLDPRFKQVYSESMRNDGVVSSITGGRFGTEKTGVKFLIKTFIDEGFFSGVGIGRYMPLDNGYLEYALQGGVVALLLYILYLLCVFLKGAKFFHLPEGRFLVVVSIFMHIASLGGPVLTANRVNIFLLVLISVFFSLIKVDGNMIGLADDGSK